MFRIQKRDAVGRGAEAIISAQMDAQITTRASCWTGNRSGFQGLEVASLLKQFQQLPDSAQREHGRLQGAFAPVRGGLVIVCRMA